MNEQVCLSNCQKIDSLIETAASNKMEHESFKRRLDNLEESSKEQNQILVTLQKQADAIESMNGKIDSVAKNVSNMAGRLNDLENEPAENWKKISFEIIRQIVMAIVGVAVGFFIST